MKTYIAILRGINVSGHKKMKMEMLREMLAELKFKNVRTYIQSGNIVFQAKESAREKLEKIIGKKIVDNFGFEVPVIVKELMEVKSVLENNPFVNKRKEDISKLHVTFLSGKPSKQGLEKIKEGNYEPDEFVVFENDIYLFCPHGYGNTKLNNNFFENKLKVVATTRNWKTVNKLAAMAEELNGA